VEDIGPWERRKLWLLNGAHTLLAFAGPPLGHVTVAEAFADGRLRKPVERFWDEASRHLPTGLELDAYRSALAVRFSNGRIEHRLEQIAQDGTRKLALRILPVAEAELAAGAMPRGCATAVAAWWRADGGDLRSVLASLSPALAGSAVFIGEVRARAAELDFAAR
jgi:fructuronate reductase